MVRTIQTTYRYRLQPTVTQEQSLRRFAGARRFVWNWALARRMEHYKTTATNLTLATLFAELTKLKQQPETAWLREMDSQAPGALWAKRSATWIWPTSISFGASS